MENETTNVKEIISKPVATIEKFAKAFIAELAEYFYDGDMRFDLEVVKIPDSRAGWFSYNGEYGISRIDINLENIPDDKEFISVLIYEGIHCLTREVRNFADLTVYLLDTPKWEMHDRLFRQAFEAIAQKFERRFVKDNTLLAQCITAAFAAIEEKEEGKETNG